VFTAEAALAAEEELRRRTGARQLDEALVGWTDDLRGHVRDRLVPRAESMLRRLQTLVRLLWPAAHVAFFGSVATGLAIPTSDLDVVVVGAPPGAFERLVLELKQQPWLHLPSLLPIPTARLPVIKLESSLERLPTDISFDVAAGPGLDSGPARHSGVQAVELVRRYMRELEPLGPLVLVLKQFVSARGLANTYGGGLASYSLVLMAVAFLQLQPVGRKWTLGEVLLRFLELYGLRFDYQRQGIDVHRVPPHFPLPDPLPAGWRGYGSPGMVLLDPLRPSCNLAVSTFAVDRVKAAFALAHEALKQWAMDPADRGLPGRLLHLQPMASYKPAGRLQYPMQT
jgi:non-canonical poly(A) RNA polymerase PAPD5/7